MLSGFFRIWLREYLRGRPQIECGTCLQTANGREWTRISRFADPAEPGLFSESGCAIGRAASKPFRVGLLIARPACPRCLFLFFGGAERDNEFACGSSPRRRKTKKL